MTRNRLPEETSPYLLQHKDNPVHWWPWGAEALAHAKETNKPILLSVGYSACHWCHVMAHESFEDQETADVMNDLFVNIKVDREERPDIDSIYMSALHTMGEQGGWPLTMFLTSDAKPFWGGTYFPKEQSYGRPSFKTLLNEISRVFKSEPDTVANNASVVLKHLEHQPAPANDVDLDPANLKTISDRLGKIIDRTKGGVQGSPKFPQGSLFEFLWRMGMLFDDEQTKEAVTTTLTNICLGGIYDHLAGGIARYSVDDKWLVPHFEKMLYDNAQLITLMTDVWQETGDDLLHTCIHQTCDWVLNDMVTDTHAFASAYDADSEGVEGKYYVWSKSEVMSLLGPEKGAEFCSIYDVTDGGNFEGENILNLLEAKEDNQEDAGGGVLSSKSVLLTSKVILLSSKDSVLSSKKTLLASRASRTPPSWDDKILVDWNGLMINALAKSGHVLSKPEWIEASIRAYDFILENMMTGGRLRHAYRNGETRGPATSADYANLIAASLSLHQITGRKKFLDDAIALTATLESHYWDDAIGGYFFTADDTDDVIVRTKSAIDDAVPAANSTMISNLMALSTLTGEIRYQDQARKSLGAFARAAEQNLFAHTRLFTSMIDLTSPILIKLLGPASSEQMKPFLTALKSTSLPGAIIMLPDHEADLPENSPAAGVTAINNQPTAYICEGQTCRLPITDLEEFKTALEALKSRFRE